MKRLEVVFQAFGRKGRLFLYSRKSLFVIGCNLLSIQLKLTMICFVEQATF